MLRGVMTTLALLGLAVSAAAPAGKTAQRFNTELREFKARNAG